MARSFRVPNHLLVDLRGFYLAAFLPSRQACRMAEIGHLLPVATGGFRVGWLPRRDGV